VCAIEVRSTDEREEHAAPAATGTGLVRPPFDPATNLSHSFLDGREPFRSAGTRLDLTLLDFWRWSDSDLTNPSTRGRLAEFLVATLLGAHVAGPRRDRPVDLLTSDGITVRVKSASFASGAGPRDLAKIHFNPLPWRASRRDPEGAARLPRLKAHVFALLGHEQEAAVDALDLDHWRFFVPPTARLEARMETQRALSLQALERLCGQGVRHAALRESVLRAAHAP
jgi:hypothetical protein